MLTALATSMVYRLTLPQSRETTATTSGQAMRGQSELPAREFDFASLGDTEDMTLLAAA